jgi:hypothetical protein
MQFHLQMKDFGKKLVDRLKTLIVVGTEGFQLTLEGKGTVQPDLVPDSDGNVYKMYIGRFVEPSGPWRLSDGVDGKTAHEKNVWLQFTGPNTSGDFTVAKDPKVKLEKVTAKLDELDETVETQVTANLADLDADAAKRKTDEDFSNWVKDKTDPQIVDEIARFRAGVKSKLATQEQVAEYKRQIAGLEKARKAKKAENVRIER